MIGHAAPCNNAVTEDRADMARHDQTTASGQDMLQFDRIFDAGPSLLGQAEAFIMTMFRHGTCINWRLPSGYLLSRICLGSLWGHVFGLGWRPVKIGQNGACASWPLSINGYTRFFRHPDLDYRCGHERGHMAKSQLFLGENCHARACMVADRICHTPNQEPVLLSSSS